MIPQLPADAIRHAIEDCDWARAAALLTEHQQALMAALANLDRSAPIDEAWLALLRTQRALAGELRIARDQAAAALARLRNEHRGARAWFRELA